MIISEQLHTNNIALFKGIRTYEETRKSLPVIHYVAAKQTCFLNYSMLLNLWGVLLISFDIRLCGKVIIPIDII